jgi:PAS domain S-box-containing protein
MKRQNKIKGDKKNVLELLRTQAEQVLARKWKGTSGKPLSDLDVSKMLHELQVYQIELEMQNDELRISHDSLEKERLRFQDIFNLAPVSYFILNEFALIEEFNDAANSLLAMSAKQLKGRRFQNFILPEDGDLFYCALRPLMLAGFGNRSCELRMRKGDGSYFYSRIEMVVIRREGKNTYLLAVIDESERKSEELLQKETLQRLDMSLSASSTGTWSMDMKTGNMEFDRYTADLFSTGRKLGGGYREFLDHVSPLDRDRIDRELHAAMTRGTDFGTEFRLTGYQSPVYVEMRGKVSDRDKSVSGIITDITNKKRLEEDAQKLKTEYQKEMIKAIIDAQEKERTRISAAIHDSLGQLLYATRLKLEQSAVNSNDMPDLLKLLDSAIREARNISFELAPSILNDHGLNVAVHEMVKRLSGARINFSVSIRGFSERVSLTAEVFVFRIMQELVNNVIKHSSATKADIVLSRQKSAVSIIVRDNGTGFDAVNDLEKGSGLSSIRNRAGVYNGSLQIKSGRTGSVVRVRLYDLQ